MLSKKAAAGSTHALIDLPVGPTAKVRSTEAAQTLGHRLVDVGRAIGLQVALRVTDGLQPVGRGIGPALEARDVLAVLRREADAPDDLRQRALRLAGDILELGGAAPQGSGLRLATEVLADGRAWAKFAAICEAQGGLRDVPLASHRQVVEAPSGGRITAIDNREPSRAAKLAGAPKAAAAGVDVHARLGDIVQRGQPLFTLHAQAPGELAYARQYIETRPPSSRSRSCLETIVFHLPGDEAFADRLVRALQAERAGLELHRFPDGESLVRLDADVTGRTVVFTEPRAARREDPAAAVRGRRRTRPRRDEGAARGPLPRLPAAGPPLPCRRGGDVARLRGAAVDRLRWARDG